MGTAVGGARAAAGEAGGAQRQGDGVQDRLQLENPESEDIDDEALNERRIVPVYRSTEGLYQGPLRGFVKSGLAAFARKLPDVLPEEMRERLELPPAHEAIWQVHFPESMEAADEARRRFAFEELLAVELGVVKRRREWQTSGAAPDACSAGRRTRGVHLHRCLLA